MAIHEGRVVCEACGTPDDHVSQLLQEAQEQINVLQRELTKRLVDKSRLQVEALQKLRNHKKYPEAENVLLHWQMVCMPTAKEPLSLTRLQPTLDRLEHRDEDELKRCADGYARFPYQGNYGRRMTHGTPEQRKVDAAHIYQDDKHVLIGLELADRATEQEQAFHVPEQRNGSELGASAARLASMGWHVFPCVANEKRPANRHGLLEAKADVRAVTVAWTRYPNLNVAVRTGKESGIVVLDVDGNIGLETLLDLVREYGSLPTTMTVKTPSGGQHYYFQHPGHELRNSASLIGPGLDIRGDGGYVLVPPSRVGGRTYEPDERAPLAPMPQWVLGLIVEKGQRMNRKIQSGEWADLMLEAKNPGQRNDTLTRIAGHLITRLPADEVMAMLINANRANFKPPLSDKEVEAVVASIARSEIRKPMRST